MASFMGLSNKLKLMIIQTLAAPPAAKVLIQGGREEDSKSTGKELKKAAGEQEQRFKTINNRKHDVRNVEFPYGAKTLLHLSFVNKALRTLSALHIFRTLILENTRCSGASIKLLSESNYGSLVRRIEIVGYASLPESHETELTAQEREDGTYAPLPSDFPADFKHVLENPGAFTQLEEVGVEFPVPELWDIYLVRKIERMDLFLQNESEQRSRALAKKYIQHSQGMLLSSAWVTNEWREMLRHLASFKISLLGGDNGAGWYVSTFHRYNQFVPDFFDMVLLELHLVEQLRIARSKHGPLGGGLAEVHVADIWCDDATALSVTRPDWTDDLTNQQLDLTPHLEVLELDYIFIGSALVAFLNTHSATLRRVALTHSYTYEDCMRWSRLLKELERAEPPFPLLREFLVDGKDKEGEGYVSKQNCTGDAVEERTLVYAWVDDKYGFTRIGFPPGVPEDILSDDPGAQETALEAWAKDREAYTKFMAMVWNNKSRLLKRNTSE